MKPFSLHLTLPADGVVAPEASEKMLNRGWTEDSCPSFPAPAALQSSARCSWHE